MQQKSETQHDAGSSSNHPSVGSLVVGMIAMETEEQLHELPSKASTCAESHQVDTSSSTPDKVSQQGKLVTDKTAFPTDMIGDESGAHLLGANSIMESPHENSSNQEASMLIEAGGEEEIMAADDAEGASYLDIINDQKDGEFFLYLLVSPRPKTVWATTYYGHKGEPIQGFQPLKLPEQARPFVGDYTCWRLRLLSPFSRAGFEVMITFPKAKLIGPIPAYGAKEQTLNKYFRHRRKKMQVEVFHKEGSGNSEQLKLALNSVLVLLSNPLTMPDCFMECAIHNNTGMHPGYSMSNASLKRACDWFAWIQRELQGPLSSNTEWAPKMALALLCQSHLLRHLQKSKELPKFLEEHCVKLLQLFANVVLRLGSMQLLPSDAATIMKQFVGNLVSLTPASQWSLHLDALCNADPRYSFLERWRVMWGNIRMEKDHCERDYEDAISHILSFCETYFDESFKLKAIKAAILATPSGTTLIRSIQLLLCSNLRPDLATEEEVEGFISTEGGQALINHFKWLVELETPKVMVELILKELSSSCSKVLRTFFRILSTILIRSQILPFTWRLVGESNSPKASCGNLIEVWACPHTFIFPLLSDETTLMYDLASRGDIELAARALLALFKKYESAENVCRKGGIKDNLKTWLQKVCARAADAIKESISQAPMTPHALYSKVTNLFGNGLQSVGFLAEAIDEVVNRLLQQRCGLQEVIQDAGKMSFFDCNGIAQQYCSLAKNHLFKHLNSNEQGGMKGLDHRATELLNWLCSRVQGDILLNGWIQEDLCTFLLDSFTNVCAENPSACDGTLVESNFKILLLQVKLIPTSHMRLHTFYQSLLAEWTSLEKEFEEQSVSLGMVSKLMGHPWVSWENVCKVQKARSEALKGAMTEVSHYTDTLLKAFYMLLDYALLMKGLGLTSRDILRARLWLEERNSRYKYFSLREINDVDHWPSSLDSHLFEAMLRLKKSKLLGNIFKIKAAQVTPLHTRITNEEEADEEHDNGDSISIPYSDQEQIADTHEIDDSATWLWQKVASIMKVSLDCYDEEWNSLSKLSYPVKKLSDLLCGLTINDIELEGNLAEAFLRCWQERLPQNFQEILPALTAWVNLQEKKSLLAPLLKVKSMLNIVEDGSKLTDTLQSLCDMCMIGSLGEYLELYNNNVEAINYFSSKESAVIKQIADSEQLISFLKERSGDDFRLLTDAIEEQAEDVLVDEATVSDLIHIDKVLRPLLKSERVSLGDLKAALKLETQSLDSASAQLCSKLSFCTINIHRIRQFVASLADRSSVLRMNMHSIMQSGVYDVTVLSQIGVGGNSHGVCSFSLKINYSAVSNSNQNSRQHFSLSELADLRSRARMLLSRRIQNDALNEESTPSFCKFEKIQALEGFVEFVNLAETFFTQVSNAYKSGHLLFGTFKWSGSGITCLQEKVGWMDGQLSCWNAALQRARLQFNCLNFFKGIELRLIHHCFSSEASPDQIQLCYELLNFVKPGLDRSNVENCLRSCICRTICKRNSTSEEANEIQMYTCLQQLSTTIQELLASVHPGSTFNQLIKKTAAPEDSVLLISVEERHLELNVVVEIFCKHGKDFQGQNNNLLLCSSKTSWEEVHLLLLRYLSSDHNYGFHVFVIAFIEKLSFECQLQLALELQQIADLPHHKGVKNQLVLVCWIGSQALQGISHHLKIPIQFMNGYGNDSIKHHLPRECFHMSVVTSELAGMGKSSSIKARGSCVSVTISREVTLESLIMKLKNTRIGAEDTLHIDITTEEGYASLNRYLFELLILGVLKSSDVGVFWLATNKVYIELANTLGNSLETNLPVCSWLPREHHVWELESLHISEDLGSDVQVVCLYLDALTSKQLDTKDIVICGAGINVSPLPEHECKKLLYNYLVKESCQMSYSVLVGFLRTLAYQFRKLSATDFYTVETLCWILRSPTPGNFRSNLVASLVQAAKELSLRSVKPWLHGEQQQVTKKDLDTSMHMRMSSLLGWSESNHVMIFFDIYGPATVLYRDKNLIPEAIRSVMMIQAEVMGTKLLDYSSLSSLSLWTILSPILGKEIPTLAPNYVLTPDNFLKMALISLRINTQVPVIIMGETGCGKTSLLKALATCCNASFSCLTLHAGSTEEDIESFVMDAGTRASSENTKVWAFLDEINACHHLGFLNGILCHHLMDGNLLPPNLVILAACNPYRLQDSESKTVGLEKKRSRPRHQLMAYKVQPLPEAMLDYVWDYGILSDNDERAYICAMVGTRSTDIIDLLSSSQKFMRDHLGVSSVSLRDIQRWISLFNWLQVDVAVRAKLNQKLGVKNIEGRAKVLACFLCYECRLSTKYLRKLYREKCCEYLRFKSEIGRAFKGRKLEDFSPSMYSKTLLEEQLDILQRMEIPPGIAINASLLENVFVVLVCMLNFLPVFVVGKPGSGKTLALQIIYSNLRGADSKDQYYQQLPRMLMLSYQGSQNSTSEGILRVFEKAKRYVESNRNRDMLVVLVLDEIGLAETSCHNPLKVLHPLLEPDVQEIAVVGISNWSLDAAKMNRGIHLSQSDPEEEDLYDTALAIFESYNAGNQYQCRERVRGLVTAYVKYHAQQVEADFHGLRDFYSLIKSLCNSTVWKQDELAHALRRNFGGGSSADILTFLSDVEELTSCKGLSSQPPPVMELIRSNLQDPEARHLLLITKGDSASSILQHILQQDDEFAIIRGSTYKDDKNEEYCYLLLGEIILHMEMGRRVLLENADQVWSSLYDMLNQHYTIAGGRKNCRIALGVYSNPMCYVHDAFRCIVIVDQEHIPQMDPPFLNRFEKQILTYESILNDSQRRAVASIRTWAHDLAASSLVARGPDSTSNDAEKQFFSGFFEDSVPSLVMHHWTTLKIEASNCSELIRRCKVDLLQTANVNAIARAHLQQNSENEEFEHWTDMFLSWDSVHSLDEAIKLHLQVSSLENWADSVGVKLIITTFTPLQWSIHQDIESTAASYQIKVYCLRLGDFTSEKQLQTHIKKFWTDQVYNLLLLQADDVSDRDHISLAKFHIDKARKAINGETTGIKKHVCLIIHVQQGRPRLSRFSFLCGWKQLTVNRLQKEPIHLRVYLEKSIPEILEHKAMPIKRIMVRVLTWSYLCIKYKDKSISASYPQEMVQLICEDEAMLTCLKQRAMEWVLKRKESLWQLTVLSNQKLLSTSASVHDAFVQYLEENIRECLARLLYLIEKTSSLKSYFLYDAHKQQVWRHLLLKPDFLNFNSAPPPCYPEGYTLEKPLELQIPFSSQYAAHVDNTFKQPYMENISRQQTLKFQYHGNATRKPNSIQRDVDASLTPMLDIIKTCIDNGLESYVVDFCNLHNIEHLQLTQTNNRALEWALRENLHQEIYHSSDIHIVFWEREREIKDQAALASLCLAAETIDQHVGELRAGRPPNGSFKEDLALQCCLSLLPTETCLNKVGGIEGWIKRVKILLKCVLPVGGPDMVFLLQTMHNFAVCVVLPLHLHSHHLSSLAASLIEDSKELCTSSLVRKVLASFPNLHLLSNLQECRCWMDFLCSMLKCHPHLPSLSDNDLRKMLLYLLSSSSPSCMMGHVLFQLLNALFLSRTNLLKGQNNIFKALILNDREDFFNEYEGDEINCSSSVFLVDFLYHKLRKTMAPVLLNKDQKQEWDCGDFSECFSLALQVCEDDVPSTLKKVTALAFMKCFLYSTASLLNEAYLSRQRSEDYCQSVHSTLLMMSPALRHTFQVFFMKILHWDFGLSADEIADVLNYCESETCVDTFSFLLDNSLLRNVRNRLGFNPFTSCSNSYMAAEMALKKVVLSRNGEKVTGFSMNDDGEMMHFFRNAGQKEQADFVAAVASQFFVMKSGRPLSDTEWNAIKWVRDLVDNLRNWDPLAKQSLRYITADTPGGIWHCRENLATNTLRSRCLILDILVTAMNLPTKSPLRGYCTLNASHLTGGHVLAELDNILQGVVGLGNFREFLCGCGYTYIIGDCTRPNELGICPNCRKAIGGHGHVLQPGNTALREVNSMRIMEGSLAGKVAFSVRIQPLSYRLLRVLVHYCFLIGTTIGGDTTRLTTVLNLPNNDQNLVHVLTKLIEADMDLIDQLIACQREATYQFIHSVLRKLPQVNLEGPLVTPHQRDEWELAFEKVVNSQRPHESISEYLQQKRTDGLNDVLQERDPCSPAALHNYFRITKKPTFSHYGTMFVQNTVKAGRFPCVAAVLAHTKNLSSLPFMLPIVEFSALLHHVIGYKITRQAAATTIIQDILRDKGDVNEKYKRFEASWNSVRLLVKGYECHQFKEPIPAMHKAQSIGLCLLEKKDQGMYLIAILEFLRTCQNDFLGDVKAGLLKCSSASHQFFDSVDANNMPTLRVQDCKAEQVVCFDETWANNLIDELSMCNPAYGKGTQVEYDDYHIEMEMQRWLIQGKTFLEGDYNEFPYQQETFQRHATLLSDVIERVTQDPLPTEKLSNINRELTMEGLGPWQLLVTLELCLGYLRRMNAKPSELLRDYCERWLGSDAHSILKKAVFDGIEVRHVVSLYEGLEAVASSGVEDMVSSSYQADLDAGMHTDLLGTVVVRRAGWVCDVGAASCASSRKGKLGAEVFRDVLKRFMFRYLTTDTFKPEDELHMYLTNEGLVTWPAEDLEAAGGSLEDIFPSSFQLRHARALYLILKQMCS